MLHDLGYKFTGPGNIAGLTLHEIDRLLSDFVERNKTAEERNREWKEAMLEQLYKENIEHGR